VRSLLNANERAERFIEQPAADAATRAASSEESGSWLGRRIRDYEVLSLLGAGGMGKVYRAKDTRLGREVALKVLPEAFARDPERVVRFEREARLLAALNHPNVAAIYGFEESEGRHVLVLELVEGEPLSERIVRGPIPLAEALPLFRQLAAGLEAAHEKGIIHRDLKPANVTITPEGQVKVLDFGLAKTFSGVVAAESDLDTMGASDPQTGEGRILGTAAYMSPEQARGQAVDKRTDVWAFGCVLYEALTGRRAFKGETVSDTLAAVLEREVNWEALPADTPAIVRSLVRRCLQKNKDNRLHDIADARIEIEEVLAEPETPEPPAPAAVHARPGWRQPLPWAAAALLAIIGPIVGWHLRRPPTPSVTRFAISVPPSHRLASVAAGPVALSPDGTRLAYSAEGAGKTQLFLRALDQLEARPLPGTEGGRAPFFSPDGNWVGFFAGDGTLQKVSVKGGTLVTICEPLAVEDQPGASWGADDTVVFSPGGPSMGLWRVSAAGGTPEELGPGRWPQVLPDGKSVLSTIWDEDGLRPAVLSLESGESRMLDRGRAGARYVPSGHLVYGESGSLMAIRFDLAQLELRGSPEPVVDDVFMHPHGIGQFTVSDTGALAYAPGRYESTLEWVDREGRSTLVETEEGDLLWPHVSPDGTRVALVRNTERIKFDVWVYGLERRTRERLTVGARTFGPVWTPDGTRVAFASRRSDLWRLYWAAADGSGEAEPLLPGAFEPGVHLDPMSWSPDGRLLAVEQWSADTTQRDIWVLSLEGDSSPFVTTSFNEHEAKFAPDGRWLAYQSNDSGRNEVYVKPYPGPGRTLMVSTDGGRDPVWSPDGRELFYLDVSGRKMMVVSFTNEPIARVGTPRLLFEGDYDSGDARQYDVAPVGQRFLMIKRNPLRSVNVVLNWFEELERLVPEED
jgi:serine/threonine protein kinase/Tol biopolymer transport system component